MGSAARASGGVDEGVEDLVVARAAHVEQVANRLLLGPGVLPPLALELEDPPIALRHCGRRLIGVEACGARIHASNSFGEE